MQYGIRKRFGSVQIGSGGHTRLTAHTYTMMQVGPALSAAFAFAAAAASHCSTMPSSPLATPLLRLCTVPFR